jgi:endonuclease YncB( thermonuclease family)
MSRIPRAAGIGAALAVIGVVWALASLFAPPGEPLVGRAAVVDGDTLRLGATRIRLLGLDAPELDQTCTDASGSDWACGRQARAFVAGLLDQSPVTCLPAGHDRYRRVLAHCRIGDTDLGGAIVAAGWAVAEVEYAAASAAARAAGRGIWASRFESPADWRRTHGEGSLWDWLRGWFE